MGKNCKQRHTPKTSRSCIDVKTHVKKQHLIKSNVVKNSEKLINNVIINKQMSDKENPPDDINLHNITEKNSEDHNYSDMLNHGKIENCSTSASTTMPTINVDNLKAKGPTGSPDSNNSITSINDEKSLSPRKIKNINDLKKVLPKVKLMDNHMNTLTDLNKTQSHLKKSPVKSEASNVINFKEQLNNYCRTCAGLKIPLVDMFSEKGKQMRLSQQMKHLEDVNEEDSLSTQMCMDCICDLKMSYKFFMQIKKAHVKLKSINSSLNVSFLQQQQKQQKLQDQQGNDHEDVEVIEEKKIGSPVKNNDTLQYKTNDDSNNKAVVIDDGSQVPQKKTSTSENNPRIVTVDDSYEKHVTDSQNSSSIGNDFDSFEEFDPGDSESEDIDEEKFEETAIEITETQPIITKCENIDEDEDVNCTENDAMDIDTKEESFYQNNSEPNDYPEVEFSSELEKIKTEEMSGDGDLSNTYSSIPKTENSLQSSNSSTGNVNSIADSPEIANPPLALKRKHKNLEKSKELSSLKQNIVDAKDQKIAKLNTLKVSPSNESGIMYVTVKGSKPNEILLVKVKKMDKTDKCDDKKDDTGLIKVKNDMKTLDKVSYLKSLTYKDIYDVKTKEIESRGAIIEEQIEEYKKKRAKILGNLTANAAEILSIDTPENNDENYGKMVDNPPIKIEPETVDVKDDEENDVTGDIIDSNLCENESDTKVENTREYSNRLEIIRQKWEQVKSRKILLPKEEEAPDLEDRLLRLLGEKDEAELELFRDYLRQRRIVISRLSDTDIVSLYRDHTAAFNDSLLPSELRKLNTASTHACCSLLESESNNYLTIKKCEDIYDCDYCPQIFSCHKVLEEHVKTHDFKLNYYCEDCQTEFSSNTAKRSHGITCLKKLVCKYCNLMLESKGKKRQHEQKHCDAIWGQLCDICGEKFKHQGTLDQHIKTQHMSWEKKFQCPKCPKRFAFKQKLTFHLKSVHTTLRAYLCEDCGADFKNPASLRHHRIRKHQPTSNKRECQVCHKLVPFYSLSKHMYTHKAYTINCPHCDKMFKNSSTLKQHIRIHEDQRQYRCDTCGVGFNRRDGLRLHMRVHLKSDSRALKECSCQICSEKFPNHSMLVIHRNRVHKDGKQYTCHICNRSMLSTRSLEWHMSHIHNQAPAGSGNEEQTERIVEKKRVSCSHCNKTFKTEMILRTHIKNTHIEKNPVKCFDCDVMFTSEVRMRHHMMIAHNRLEGTLTCPHCPKRFVNQLRLKTHMISHSEERPYTCEICGFNLKTKIQLIKHHQNRHSDERPLQCRYCPWRCKQVSALVCHERTHTNERPYACSVCKQRFKYLGDKNKHERRHESLGGTGFKRIVIGRNVRHPKYNNVEIVENTSTTSDQDHLELQDVEYDADAGAELTIEQEYEMEQMEEDYEGDKYEAEDDENIEFKETEGEMKENYNNITDYEQQEYEETSREASEAAEVIMSIEDTAVYTEEVTADNIEHAGIITDQIMTEQILQAGTVVHLEQQDDEGKIQVIPVMLSLPDLTVDPAAEVNLTSATIMYNS